MERRRDMRLRLVPLVAVVVALGACTAGDSEEGAGEEATGAEVSIEGLAFDPTAVEVAKGTTVTWVNGDSVAHTVTSGEQGEQGAPGVSEDVPAAPDGLFDGRFEGEGDTFVFTFENAGTYTYYCDIHRQMRAEVVVR